MSSPRATALAIDAGTDVGVVAWRDVETLARAYLNQRAMVKALMSVRNESEEAAAFRALREAHIAEEAGDGREVGTEASVVA